MWLDMSFVRGGGVAGRKQALLLLILLVLSLECLDSDSQLELRFKRFWRRLLDSWTARHMSALSVMYVKKLQVRFLRSRAKVSTA
jgi:hypothetical protein